MDIFALTTGVDFNRFVDEVPVGLFRTDVANGTFFFANQYCAELLGKKSPSELVGLSVNDFYNNIDQRNELIRLIRSNGKVSHFEIKLKSCDNDLWVSLTAHINCDGHCIQGCFIDITDKKKMEEELYRLKNKQLCKAMNLGHTIDEYLKNRSDS
jgi:PAS domain S-box-containing protein